MVGKTGLRAFALGLLASAAFAGATGAAAQYQTLHSFTGTDGDRPQSGLVIDAKGNLYGTAPTGGAHSLGVAFRVAPDGTFSVLHDFKGGHDGATPSQAPLAIGPDGALYGTTQDGGVANGGTLYRLTRKGGIKILHSFGVGDDGYAPASDVRIDAEGNFTGTTSLGGTAGNGVIYRIAPDGIETVLHNFAGGAGDGRRPMGTLTADGQGNLFGVTYEGGPKDNGTVYKLAPDGTESVLFSFTGSWANPAQGLAIDRHGNLYGTTTSQGTGGISNVFKVTQDGKGKVLYRLGLEMGSTAPALLRDRAGTLYGTTPGGGGNQTGGCFTAGGCGMFFALNPDRSLDVIYGFGGDDGLFPAGGVVTDGHGNYYGTTMGGGAHLHGTIFKISTGSK